MEECSKALSNLTSSTLAMHELQQLLSMTDFTNINSSPTMMPRLPTSSLEKLEVDTAPTSTSSQLSLFPLYSDLMAMGMYGLPPLFSMQSTLPFSTSLPYTSMASMASMPPHSSFDNLAYINNAILRPSLSAMTSPVQPADVRPRAFSSAATLQHPAVGEKRRKRSRKSLNETQAPSLLRMLMDEKEEEPIKLAEVSAEDNRRVRLAAARVLSGIRQEPPAKVSPISSDYSDQIPLRRIIRDQDLPDTVGPDSPFRHHPKYQRKNHIRVVEDMQALTAMMEAAKGLLSDRTSSSPEGAASESGYSSQTSSKKSLSDILDQAIGRELITAE